MRINSGEGLNAAGIPVKSASGQGKGTGIRKQGQIVPQEGNIGIRNLSERSQIDALILAQVSKNVIDKAIVISSRLRSMAGEALMTGNIDNDEVQTELSRIQGTISQHGERVFTPTSENTGVREEFLQNARNVESLGQRMLEGRTDESVTAGLDRVVNNFQGLAERTGGTAAGAEINSTQADDMIARLTGEIVSNSEKFMNAQGNINSANAKILTN